MLAARSALQRQTLTVNWDALGFGLLWHDTLELVYTIDRFQLGNGTRWLENWERVWADNLQTCVDGMCEVRLS